MKLKVISIAKVIAATAILLPALSALAASQFRPEAVPFSEGFADIDQDVQIPRALVTSKDALSNLVLDKAFEVMPANRALGVAPQKEALQFERQYEVKGTLINNQTYFIYNQLANGIKVEGSQFRVFSRDSDGGMNLHYTDYRIADVPNKHVQRNVTEKEALAKARAISKSSAPVFKNELLYRYINNEWRPVYDVEFEGTGLGISVDVETGKVTTEQRRSYMEDVAPKKATGVSGSVTGTGYLFDPSKATSALKLSNLAVTLSDGSKIYTDANGAFNVASLTTVDVTLTLNGKFAHIVPAQGTALSVKGSGSDKTPLNVNFNDSPSEFTTAQVQGYYHANVVHDFANAHGMKNAKFDRPVSVTVSETDVCNAYYQSGALNFFNAGAYGSYVCRNTAYDTVIYHEYGHLIDDSFGGITDSGTSEGWGDTMAMLITRQPVVGEQFFVKAPTADKFIRTGDNTYVLNLNDEVHKQGMAFTGFVWHLRQALVAKYGEDKGSTLTEDLILPSLPSNAINSRYIAKEVLMRDTDKNGVAADKAEIVAAAKRHGIDQYVK